MNNITPFKSGDCISTEKREAAVTDAIVQGALQEEGSTRKRLYALQEAVGSLPAIDFPLQHVFAPGVYARTIFLPKNSIILGKIHKHKHINILSQGKVSMVTESGGLEVLDGPVTMASLPGTKRAVFAHTNAIWTTIHLTEETDLDKIEEETIAKTYEEYDLFLAQQDYYRVLAETGYTHKQLVTISENILDQVRLPKEINYLVIKDSPISGKGLFTEKEFSYGEYIGPARISGKRTLLGRYVNHSDKPNAEYVLLENGDLNTVAIKKIKAGDEILYDYRQGASLYGVSLNQDEVRKTKEMLL